MRRFSFVALVYIIVGVVIALSHHYITTVLLKGLVSAVLVTVLWWLVLLGVNLHISW